MTPLRIEAHVAQQRLLAELPGKGSEPRIGVELALDLVEGKPAGGAELTLRIPPELAPTYVAGARVRIEVWPCPEALEVLDAALAALRRAAEERAAAYGSAGRDEVRQRLEALTADLRGQIGTTPEPGAR